MIVTIIWLHVIVWYSLCSGRSVDTLFWLLLIQMAVQDLYDYWSKRKK